MTVPRTLTLRESRPRILGSKRANIVTQRDSEWEKVQFRVQCEVWIPLDEASIVDKVCSKGAKSEDELNAALEVVLRHKDGDASTDFVDLLKLAFKDQRNPVPQDSGSNNQ